MGGGRTVILSHPIQGNSNTLTCFRNWTSISIHSVSYLSIVQKYNVAMCTCGSLGSSAAGLESS